MSVVPFVSVDKRAPKIHGFVQREPLSPNKQNSMATAQLPKILIVALLGFDRQLCGCIATTG